MNERETSIFILPTDTCYGIACAFHDKKSYERIYKIKKRKLDKALAILVESFSWLGENTDLTDEQIEFLKNYERPFTILTQSSSMRLFLEYQGEEEEYFINKDIYEELSFRIAHNGIQESLIAEHGPLWLTSANLANTGENYNPEEIEEQFGYYLDNDQIQLLGRHYLDEDNKASDVFRFVGDSVEVEYLRKY